MEKILIPYFVEHISPRLEYAETFLIFSLDKDTIISKEIFKIASSNLLEKLNCIKKLNPNVVICNGISSTFHENLINANIEVISWQEGKIDTLIVDYLNQKLKKKKA